jgi:quercetin dioxygenase-like cupin family protein
MRTIASVAVSAVVVAAQSYPPPFPRAGASKLLDNPRVQVWDVSWPKGQPTALHRHPYAMTGVYYAPGDRMITAVDGSKRPVTTKAGGIVWQLKGLTHIEEGTSDEPLRSVMVELKGDGPSGTVDRSSEVPAFTGSSMPLLDNERVTVWDYSAAAGTPARHRHTRDTVVVWTESRAGHATFLPAGTVHAAEAIGGAAKATIFELK